MRSAKKNQVAVFSLAMSAPCCRLSYNSLHGSWRTYRNRITTSVWRRDHLRGYESTKSLVRQLHLMYKFSLCCQSVLSLSFSWCILWLVFSAIFKDLLTCGSNHLKFNVKRTSLKLLVSYCHDKQWKHHCWRALQIKACYPLQAARRCWA